MRCTTHHSLFAAAVASLFAAASSHAQTTDITYQGELKTSGTPANGLYDFRFTIFDAQTAGVQLSFTSEHQDLQVTDGLFTAQLAFGATPFSGTSPRWLQIEVRPGASTGAFESLAPRQQLTATPFSIATQGISVNPNTGFVGIGRDSRVSVEEVFGVYRNTTAFGGMYIQTNAGGKPFYGYSEAGLTSAYTYWNGADDTWRLNISGDRLIVTNGGNLGIATAAPSEKLDVNGNARATNFLYSAPQTRYYAVPGAAFTSTSPTVLPTIENAANGTSFADTVAAASLVAPITLPDGVTITAVDYWVFDNASSFLTLSLIRRPHGAFGQTVPASSNSGNSAGMQQITQSPALLVDNQNNSYFLRVDSADWMGGMAIFSARVTYTTTKPD